MVANILSDALATAWAFLLGHRPVRNAFRGQNVAPLGEDARPRLLRLCQLLLRALVDIDAYASGQHGHPQEDAPTAPSGLPKMSRSYVDI